MKTVFWIHPVTNDRHQTVVSDDAVPFARGASCPRCPDSERRFITRIDRGNDSFDCSTYDSLATLTKRHDRLPVIWLTVLQDDAGEWRLTEQVQRPRAKTP